MGIIGAIWAVLGVSVLLLNAILRLAPRAMEALGMDLNFMHWALMIGFLIFMIYAEGYKGFQKKFSPRTAARVKYLKENPTLLRVILAPVFAMGFFQANKKTRIVAWILPVMIIILICVISQISQPVRGLIDVGVVVGLSYGLISFWLFCLQAFTNKSFNRSPEMP